MDNLFNYDHGDWKNKIKENTKTIPDKINMIFDFHFGVQTTQILSPHQNGL